MDQPTAPTLEPSSAPHDLTSTSSMIATSLEGQRTGDSGSASDTTHTTDTLPSSIGSGAEDSDAIAPLRQSAMRKSYHRHMARSAAKRESVAALPSIRDLQIHFSGGSIQHRAGAGAGIRSSPLGAMREEEEGQSHRYQPWKDIHLARVHPDEARKEANNRAREVGALWANQPAPADVRAVFVDTASAVRRVRTLALSLVPPGQRRVSAPQRAPATFSTPSRPSGVGQPTARVVSTPMPPAADPSAPMRRAALDFLGHLRALEERLRVTDMVPTVVVIPENAEPALVESPIEETHSPVRRASGSHSRSISPTTATSGASCDDEWSDDEDYDVNAVARLAEAARSHPPWEERILTEARSYRTISDEDWAKESAAANDAARRWIEVVGRLFREHTDSPTDAWVVEGSSGMDRVHAFLNAHLTAEHAALLPSASDESQLLERLSDGYLLAQAYNSYLLTSSRPWGFVPDEDLHDTLGAESESGREGTFRRVDNLTCWAAAVRMRFNIPIAMPTTNTSGPDRAPIPASKAAAQAALGRRRSLQMLEFDPLVVAKHGDNWETALRTLIVAWVAEAAREVRDRVVTPESGESSGAKEDKPETEEKEDKAEKAEEKTEDKAEEVEEKAEEAEEKANEAEEE